MALKYATTCDTPGCLALHLAWVARREEAAGLARVNGWQVEELHDPEDHIARCPGCLAGRAPVLERGECPVCMGAQVDLPQGARCHTCRTVVPHPVPEIAADGEADAW